MLLLVPEYNQAVRRIDQSLKVTNATLVKVPLISNIGPRLPTNAIPTASLAPIPVILRNGFSTGTRVDQWSGTKGANVRLMGRCAPTRPDCTWR